MWIEELKNGKFKAVERYTVPLTGQVKRVSITIDKNTAKSRKEAQAILYTKIEKALGSHNPRGLTLETLVDLYREDQIKTVKASTYKRNFFACETLKKILGKNTLCNKLTAGYVRSQFLATGEAPGTLNEHLVRFKALIRWGYHNDYLTDISYIDKIYRFKDKSHKEKIQNKYLEAAEVNALLESMSVLKWHNLTKFLVLSGLRIGESLALQISDIDIKNRLIHVTKTYDIINDIVTTPKTLCSTRDVYMQDELFILSKQIRQQALTDRMIYGNNLFFQSGGKMLQYDAYRKYLKEHTKTVVGKVLTPHALRHTHASLMLENGISIDEISRRLGHENSKVTKEIYLHITEKLRAKENERIQKISIL